MGQDNVQGARASMQADKPSAEETKAFRELLDRSPFAIEQRRSSFENDGYVLPPPKLLPCALYGILEPMVNVASDKTEAVPAAVAINILARFAAIIGRTAHIQIGDQTRYLNFNALIVGPTSKGRKGTSAEMPAQLFRIAEWLNGPYTLPLQELTALSTGEGLVHRVRDPRYDDESGKCKDKGVTDKRLICDVSEFGGTLTVAARKENTLTAVLRDAFDGRVLTIPTKTSFNRATGAHIVVVGSIPETELVKLLSQTDITNGLANRFAMFYSARTKLVPDPKPAPQEEMDRFAAHLKDAINQAMGQHAIVMDDEAKELWEVIYESLNETAHDPSISKLLAREELYTRIFAALLTLINGETVITTRTLDAGMAWRHYWEETLNFVFSSSEKNENMKVMREFMDRIVQVITTLGGKRVPHTDLTKKLTNNYSSNAIKKEHVKAALEFLQRESPPRVIVETEETNGRPRNLYTLAYLRK